MPNELQTIPKPVDNILGELMHRWATVNVAGLKKIKEFNDKWDNFLLMPLKERKKYMKKHFYFSQTAKKYLILDDLKKK